MSATLTTKRKSARDRPLRLLLVGERVVGRGERKRDIDRRARGRSAQRHARRDDQREREGPCCSAMKALQSDDPLSRTLAPLSSIFNVDFSTFKVLSLGSKSEILICTAHVVMSVETRKLERRTRHKRQGDQD